MTKRLVEINDDILAAAQAALGARTTEETVQRALQEAARQTLRRELLTRAMEAGLADLRDPAVMADAWR